MFKPPFMYTLQQIKNLVSEARYEAVMDAHSGAVFIRSRGTFLGSSDKGATDGDAYTWDGTIKGIFTYLKQYPEAPNVIIGGGYDGASSLRDFRDGNYDPWISCWDVEVWNRKDYTLFLKDRSDLPTLMGLDPWLNVFIEEALATSQNSLEVPRETTPLPLYP